MKKYENVIQAMIAFRDAYDAMLVEFNDYEITTGESVNDIPGFNEHYPLDVSLDEFPIDRWINTIMTRIHEKNFKVLNYEYLNTGGNTMVGIFTVWLPKENRTVYVHTNEVGCGIATVDYIGNEIEIDDYDDIIIESVDFDNLIGTEEYFELYRYCLNEYTKSDCRYFGISRAIPYKLLSDEVQSKVHPDYYVWLEEHNYDVMTDGVDIMVHPDYDMLFTDPHEDDENLQAVKEWKLWHDGQINRYTTDEELEDLYEKTYHLTFNGRVVRLPFNADTFNKINDLLDSVIREW